MWTINAEKLNTLRLGKSGENLVTCVRFDISKWVKDFGDGTAVLCHMRPEDTEPYITSTTLEDGIVSWNVTSTDTAQAGIGKCELQYIVDDVVIKSKVWQTVILKSLDDAGDTPDPESGWVADLIAQITELVSTVPSVTIKDTDTGAVLIVTDANGTTSQEIYDGEAATIDVGAVETGEPGTDASVTNSGTTSAAIFNFVIPRGDKGEKGNILWPLFDVDGDRGMLEVSYDDDYDGPDYSVNDSGHLEVIYE